MQMNIRVLGLPSDADPSQVHDITFDHFESGTAVYRYGGTATATPETHDEADIWRRFASVIYGNDSQVINKDQRNTAKRVFFEFLYIVSRLPGNEHFRLSPIEAGHQHDPSSFLTSCGACLEDARQRFHGQQQEHSDFVNEIVERAPEAYDGDSAAEAIAVEYVRDLERIRDRTFNALDQIGMIVDGSMTSLGPAATLYRLIEFVTRFRQNIRTTARVDTESYFDTGHDHAPVCEPGCPAFDIAKAWADELPEHCDAIPWDRRTPENQALLQQTVVSLLEKGLISR